MNRPANMSRPMGNMNRPAPGNMARPNFQGNMNRPAVQPGQVGMNRPGPGVNRPNPGGGFPGGTMRPGPGGLPGASTRPAPGAGLRPGPGGNRPGPGGGFNPGAGTRPGPGPIAGGNRPGPIGGGGNRPGFGPGPGAGGNRPGPIGGGNRPGWNGGGQQWNGGGNRPGWNGGGQQWAGGGNRPGGGVRPGWNGGGNRPGWNGGGQQWNGGNRPGWNGNVRPGWNNRPGVGQIGDNLGVVNRPSFNNNINNINTNINNVTNVNNINNNVFRGGNNYNVNRGGWGGGGWGGGGNWNSGWGGGGNWNNGWRGGGGWASPYYGNWYQGGWGGNGFWSGFGAGALTSFGLSTLGSSFGSANYGVMGYPSYGYSTMGVYDYFPTWSVSNFNSWGLGGVANSLVYSNYTNPYYATVVAAQPAQTAVVYDYSQPINVAAPAPAEDVAESTEQVFSAARDAFKAGDYQHALDLTDQVLKKTPDVPVVHEFRALALFALKRYDEASAVDYAVLSAGPGWNWATLVGLYPNVETYTNQVRELEAVVRGAPTSPSPLFLLAYHYLVQGHKEAAAAQFEKVSQLAPDDKLAASFVKALRKVAEQPAATPVLAQAVPAQPAATPGQPAAAGARPAQASAAAVAAESKDESAKPAEPPPPPPANLVGTWKAQPAADVAIALTLEQDGKFSWEVDSKGHKETLTGQAGFKDETLALFQVEGPPLAGKVTQSEPNKFVFNPSGTGDKSPGLTFTR
ncbi:MAG: thioredoxin [Paludisphaera borealis]|uniref:tetratricopeptide repeat protein n=1 Tax=Paludisphaera borealis TaxID=1387353 RepID=UPI00284CE8C6|nr:thioredoxin [Paludisphaera borealis]MDR3619424.1 thioredoxin [Paludisphaera borealis]